MLRRGAVTVTLCSQRWRGPGLWTCTDLLTSRMSVRYSKRCNRLASDNDFVARCCQSPTVGRSVCSSLVAMKVTTCANDRQEQEGGLGSFLTHGSCTCRCSGGCPCSRDAKSSNGSNRARHPVTLRIRTSREPAATFRQTPGDPGTGE